jgi:AcrR family transcriptional regulator
MSAVPPARTERTPRAVEIVGTAQQILEREGADALTMRRLADDVGIRASSIYKHFADKASVESALIEDALVELGTGLHDAVTDPDRAGVVASLLTRYRTLANARPNVYRLATSGPLDRGALPAGLEDWAGEPFFLATGDPHRAQALWSFAHGMVILEIDGRFADVADLDRTWRAGAEAFATVSPVTPVTQASTR